MSSENNTNDFVCKGHLKQFWAGDRFKFSTSTGSRFCLDCLAEGEADGEDSLVDCIFKDAWERGPVICDVCDKARTIVVDGVELWWGFTCHQDNFDICGHCCNDQFSKTSEFGHMREHRQNEHSTFRPILWTYYWTWIVTRLKTIHRPPPTITTASSSTSEVGLRDRFLEQGLKDRNLEYLYALDNNHR